LKSMDLIRSVGATGYEVTNVKQELLNILDIRAALEAHAVRRAAGVIGRGQLARIAQFCDEMEQLPFEASDKRSKLNRQYHEEIIRASGNKRLLRLVSDYEEYFSVAQPLFDKNFIIGTQREHRAILDALNDRDGDNAAELIVQHILGAAKFLQGGSASPVRAKTTR
jgi:DNA-binding GntR family transcriptional regulator